MFNFVMRTMDRIDDVNPIVRSFFLTVIFASIIGFLIGYGFLIIILPIPYSISMIALAAFLVLWGYIYINISLYDDRYDLDTDIERDIDTILDSID